MDSWWPPLGAGLIVSAAIVAAAVWPKEAKPKRAPDRSPRVEATIDLPGNSQVHVIAVPTGYKESSRCVVAVSAAGQTSVACTQREFDLADD